jgi:hypothetical protein
MRLREAASGPRTRIRPRTFLWPLSISQARVDAVDQRRHNGDRVYNIVLNRGVKFSGVEA